MTSTIACLAAADGDLVAVGAGAGAGPASWMLQPGKVQAAPRRRKSDYEWAVRCVHCRALLS